jgi:hypothetical protein
MGPRTFFRRISDSKIETAQIDQSLTNLCVNARDAIGGVGKLPDHYGFGNDDEAVIYAHGNIAARQETPGALEWLGGQAEEWRESCNPFTEFD